MLVDSISWAPWVIFLLTLPIFAYTHLKESFKKVVNFAGSLCHCSVLCYWNFCSPKCKFLSLNLITSIRKWFVLIRFLLGSWHSDLLITLDRSVALYPNKLDLRNRYSFSTVSIYLL